MTPERDERREAVAREVECAIIERTNRPTNQVTDAEIVYKRADRILSLLGLAAPHAQPNERAESSTRDYLHAAISACVLAYGDDDERTVAVRQLYDSLRAESSEVGEEPVAWQVWERRWNGAWSDWRHPSWMHDGITTTEPKEWTESERDWNKGRYERRVVPLYARPVPPAVRPDFNAAVAENLEERRSGPTERRGSWLGSPSEASAAGRPFIVRSLCQCRRSSPEGRTHG